jgi:hypothetical protein
MCLQ